MGVGQYEEPVPKVACARFSRREQACADRVAQAAKVAGDVPKSQGHVAPDVFEEDPSGPDFLDDARDLGPEVAGIVGTPSMAGLAEGLAGIAGRDEIHTVAPWSAVEGSQIVPYSRRSQGLVFHPGHESGRSVGLPLDVTHSAISGLGDVQAKVEASVSGAKGKALDVTGAGVLGT